MDMNKQLTVTLPLWLWQALLYGFNIGSQSVNGIVQEAIQAALKAEAPNSAEPAGALAPDGPTGG